MSSSHINWLEYIREEICAELPESTTLETSLPGLTYYRRHSENVIDTSTGQIMVALLVSGKKATRIGERDYVYDAGQCLVSGVALPATFHAVKATPAEPFLALSVELDLQMLVDVATRIEMGSPCPEVSEGVFVLDANEDLLETFYRLTRLQKRSREEIAIRAPLLLADLHYLLLASSCGPKLRALASVGTQSHAILKSVSWIKVHFREHISIESLARAANMSVATYHRHFRTITGISPLQFQKRIRIYEAQRLMLSNGCNVANAAYDVGYESPTQFSREYKTLFGVPPLQHIRNKLLSEQHASV